MLIKMFQKPREPSGYVELRTLLPSKTEIKLQERSSIVPKRDFPPKRIIYKAKKKAKVEKELEREIKRFRPSVFSIPREESCTGKYKIQGKIGSGAYGTVSSACYEDNCNFVLKEVKTTNLSELTSSEIDAIMLRSLQSEHWLNSVGERKLLVPRYYGSWLCDEGLVIVLDRWSGNMKEKGENNYAKKVVRTKNNLLYTKQELDDMFNIARRLDELGIIHGDLKPDQYLYRDNDMVITDFGLATTFGWSSTAFSCPHPYETKGGQVPPEIRNYFNQWQLAVTLTKYYRTFVSISDGGIEKDVLFVGLNFLPEKFENETKKLCSEFFSGVGSKRELTNVYTIPSIGGLPQSSTPIYEFITLDDLGNIQAKLRKGTATQKQLNDAIEKYLLQ